MIVRKRMSIEVIMDILEAMKEESVPTRVMYKTSISWMAFSGYIKKLADKGYVTIETEKNGKKTLHLTEKAKSLLNEFKGSLLEELMLDAKVVRRTKTYEMAETA